MAISNLEFKKKSVKSSASALGPALSDYLDYRLFLQDYFDFRRQESKHDRRPYSYQMFSAAADIKSPNYLKMIIEGKRNLSREMTLKFARAMGLQKDLSVEFDLLVQLNQAEDPSERNLYLKKLSEHRVQQKLKSGEIDLKNWERIPNWVTWIVYAMADQAGAQFDLASLKKALRGKASEDEITLALNSLLKSQELVSDPVTGLLKKNRSTIETTDEVPVALVRKLQAQLMTLGLESLYQDQPTDREFGTLTMCLTKSEFEEIKFKLRQMRKGLHKDNANARTSTQGERVYQLNIQLYPVTDVTLSANDDSKIMSLLENGEDEKAHNTSSHAEFNGDEFVEVSLNMKNHDANV